MKERLLMVSDCVVSPEMYKTYFSFAWDAYDVEMIEDLKGYTDIDFQKLMLGTEQNGPEAYEENNELLEKIPQAQILIVHMSIINKKVLDAAKGLKLILICRGGCDNVNTRYAIERGITLVNAASRSADSVADFTVGMMIAEMKNMVRSAIALHEGKWKKEFSNFGHHHNMKNQVVGIIGFGEIGVRVAERLRPFGCRIMVHDPYLSKEKIRERGGEPVQLERLLKESDLITIHLRLSDFTRHFLGEKDFRKMKNTAYFINNARSGLVDQEAMIKALKEHWIMGAALDVYDEEPLPAHSPLRQLDNVTLTPHMAGVSCDTVTNGVELMAEELRAYSQGEPLKNIVTER